MKEIRLNKALYEEKTASGGGRGAGSAPAGAAGPPVREARASLFARLGALLVDLLLLHALAMAITRFAPAGVVALRGAAPWVGYAVGVAYFAVGYGPLTGGRTVGKFVVRLRVADLSGPPLPHARAWMRALGLLAPAGIYLATTQVDEMQFRPDSLEIYPRYALPGLALMVGWLLGNALFSRADAHGQAWYDHFVGSVNVTADAPVEAQGAFVRDARAMVDAGRLRRSRLWLGGTIVTLVGVSVFWLYLNKRMLAEAPEEMRAVWASRNEAFHVEGFLPPFKVRDDGAARNATDDADGATSTVVYEYHARRPVDAADLRARPEVQNAVDRIAAWFRESTIFLYEEQAREAVRAAAEGKPVPEVRPIFSDQFRLRTRFTEYADLFWASSAHEVMSLSRMVDLRDLTTTVTARRGLGTAVGIDAQSTATAAAEVTADDKASTSPATADADTTSTR